MALARIALGGAPRLVQALTWAAVVVAAVLFSGPGTNSTGHAGTTCYLLTKNVGSGSGSITNMPSSAGGCPTNQYTPSYPATLLAEPAPGYVLGSWSGTDNNGTNPTTVTMIGDRKVTAYFAWNCYPLTMNVGGGSGSVSASPTSWGGCPLYHYPQGYTVTVLANSAPGYVFGSWSGTDNNGVNPTTVTMIGARKVTAYFSWNCYTLTKNVGTGSGSVSASPTSAGGCPPNQYPQGYGVSVLANPAAGYAFSSWNGTDNNNVNPTSVTMNGNRKVTANFAWNCYTLTRNVGSGSGSINRTPANSGGCPTDQYWPGTQVTLTAKPAPGSSFINWSGTNNNGANPSWVMMNGNRKVTAFFTGPPAPTNTPPFTPTNTPSPTPTSTPVPTSTPTPKDPGGDTDSDTVPNGTDPNDDNDGCTDLQELSPDPYLGGQRDPHNFWDFFDVPAGAGLTRDGYVTGQDIFAVISRFNTTDSGPGDFDRNSDPFSTPNQLIVGQDRQNYHPAYDRGPLVGPNPWNLGPPDGSVTALEIFAIVAQFGHSCA